MSELDDILAEANEREAERRQARNTRNDEGDALAVEVAGRARGLNAEQARKAKADEAERDRLRALGVRFD